jgi:hypothetical protein
MVNCFANILNYPTLGKFLASPKFDFMELLIPLLNGQLLFRIKVPKFLN